MLKVTGKGQGVDDLRKLLASKHQKPTPRRAFVGDETYLAAITVTIMTIDA